MHYKQSNNIRLGVFVTVVLILFAVGIYNIGNKQNLFGTTFSLSTIVQNANGLQPGNNVRYAGINVGIVDQINFLNDSTLQIDMLIQGEIQGILKKNAVASIGSDGLVGNMIVNIDPGKGNGADIEEGDIITSEARTETRKMLDALDKSSGNISALTSNLLEISEKVNNGSGSLSLLLNDANFSQDITQSIQSLKLTSNALAEVTKTMQSSMEEVVQGNGVLGYLLKDTTLETNINQLSQNLDDLFNEHITPIIQNLETSSKSIANSTEALESKVDQLTFNKGLAGAVLNDSLMAEDLKITIENLAAGTEGFKQNMEALKQNFLFKKYFKKMEKKRQKEKDSTAMN